MNSSLFGVIELALVFGIVLGLGVWQLWSVRREMARDKVQEKEARSSKLTDDHSGDTLH